jgi:Ca-activated chloride channel family protein
MGDKYTAPGTNPFVLTAHDPFSTFGADVDTASYDIFRRDVNLGMLPQPASVRLEEYVNAFSYEYPAPAANAEHPFQVSLAAAAQALDRPTVLLRVGLQATKPPPQDKRPANLVYLVDVSGSMASADKLPLVQQVLRQTLDLLAPTDTVSIVTYAGDTRVRLPPTPVSQRALITAQIDGLHAGGGTYGAGGIDLAYQQANAGFIEGGINHVLLCTDGDFNVGPSSTQELLTLIRSKRNMGVTLTVLGFGVGNLNDTLMETISDAGDGVYGVISNEDQAARYVHDRLLSTIVHVAKDLKLQVEFNPDRVAAYRLLGYEDRAIADTDFRNDVVDAGEVGAGHRVTALYELVLTGQPVPMAAGAPAPVGGAASTLPREVAAGDLVLVKVRYKPVDAIDSTPAREVGFSLPNDEVSEGLMTADADLQWAAAVAAYAEILKRSPYADRSLLPEIERIVTTQALRDADRTEFTALFARAKPMLK